tara:strand:+ start:7027 stop:7383 length:357 start_codon:yes stop_codon:yes gene_type:complete
MLKKETKIEEVEEVIETKAVKATVEDDSQGIEVGTPMDLRPTELPLVIKLPADASEAQIAYAKTLNGYAYKNPTKFEEKKNDRIVNGTLVKGLITKLKELKNAPAPVEGNLKINKSSI